MRSTLYYWYLGYAPMRSLYDPKEGMELSLSSV